MGDFLHGKAPEAVGGQIEGLLGEVAVKPVIGYCHAESHLRGIQEMLGMPVREGAHLFDALLDLVEIDFIAGHTVGITQGYDAPEGFVGDFEYASARLVELVLKRL